MISKISIKDFAIIQNLEIEFNKGLNILTGETGSGKSIIIEAISLALGSRADTSYIRSGCQKAVIQLVIDPDSTDESIILTRELLSTGKSLCRIDDEIVSLSHLNGFCRKLVDIHGQYDHQSLLNQETHLSHLDSFGSQEILNTKNFVSELYHSYAAAEKELNQLKKAVADGEKKRNFLQFELEDINSANLVFGEDESLTDLLSLLQNSEKIFSNLNKAYQLLNEEDDSAIGKIGSAMNYIKEISYFSSEISEMEELISDYYYGLEDTAANISKYMENIDFSPERINSIIERLDVIDLMKRKYGASIKNILEYKDQIEKELHVIENHDDIMKLLTEKSKMLSAELSKKAEYLSSLRKETATIIEESVIKELKDLNFTDASFKIIFNENKDANGKHIFTETGFDNIEFMLTANKGEPLKPLAKVASGGEISRIMLAFKRILGDYANIPSMIFDEIDSGISGTTASIVGMKLAEISKNHQVLCITHLPQIAVMGDSHYRIFKTTDDSFTYTMVEPIALEDKIREIARLSGGITITDATLKNAEEMLNMADDFKKQH